MLTRIGVTGGIGSGKSEVCEKFKTLGIVTLSADTIAHQLTESDPLIRKKIISRFGVEAYDANSGALNRQYIAQLVFGNKDKLATLNSIIHPAVFKSLELSIRSIEGKQKSSYVIVEAALMFESKLHTKVDYVLAVVADELLRIERVKQRDHLSEKQIKQRMTNQSPVEEAIEASDFVLYNNDSLEELHSKVNFFHTIFLTLKPRLNK